jgi:hypothetical protein
MTDERTRRLGSEGEGAAAVTSPWLERPREAPLPLGPDAPLVPRGFEERYQRVAILGEGGWGWWRSAATCRWAGAWR